MDEKEREEEYKFVKEVIKEKPLDVRKLAARAGGVAAAAVLFGAVAAFTFSRLYPVFSPEAETEAQDGDVADDSGDGTDDGETAEISDDAEEEGNAGGGSGVAEQDSESAAGDGDGAQDSGQDDGGEMTGDAKTQDGGGESGDGDPEEEPLAIADLSSIQEEVNDYVEAMEKAIVTVRGITSDVDWMDNAYEDEMQISGLLVAKDGTSYYVLTEYRVVDQVDRILVTLADGSSVDAHFQKQDPGTGLAVLKIAEDDVAAKTRQAIAVADLEEAAEIERGQLVLALGSPAGYSDAVAGGIITSVSNVRSSLDNEYHVLTTDIAGDSGGSGILMDMEGRLAGVILQDFSIASREDLVTALSVEELKDVVEKLVANEEIVYLGIQGIDIDSALADKTGIPKGIYVQSVEEDSPAMEGGLQNGDVIVKIGESETGTLTRLRSLLDQQASGQKTEITAMRKGSEGYVEIIFDVTLGAV